MEETMNKVIPFASSHHGKADRPGRAAGSLLDRLSDWVTLYRRRKSLHRVPDELLDDILCDEDAKTREIRRRAPTRFDTQIWS